jgi:hypothetical protein
LSSAAQAALAAVQELRETPAQTAGATSRLGSKEHLR